jgi:hypothetical protein
MSRAKHRDNLDAGTRWAKGSTCVERLRDALIDAYRHGLQRIAAGEAPTAPRRRS